MTVAHSLVHDHNCEHAKHDLLVSNCTVPAADRVADGHQILDAKSEQEQAVEDQEGPMREQGSNKAHGFSLRLSLVWVLADTKNLGLQT